MSLPKRDIIATGLVALALVAYVLWLLDATPTGLGDTRVTGLVILGLGILASAVAVVPSFGQLVHGNKEYLAATSILGLAALVAGVVMLSTESGIALAVLVAALAVLWVVATSHHVMLAKARAGAMRRS